MRTTYIKFEINCLQTKREVIQWYLEMNEGQVAHTETELNIARTLLEECV